MVEARLDSGTNQAFIQSNGMSVLNLYFSKTPNNFMGKMEAEDCWETCLGNWASYFLHCPNFYWISLSAKKYFGQHAAWEVESGSVSLFPCSSCLSMQDLETASPTPLLERACLPLRVRNTSHNCLFTQISVLVS